VDLLLRDDARPVSDQQVEELKRFRLEMDLGSADEQLPCVRIEDAIAEMNSHGPRSKSSDLATVTQGLRASGVVTWIIPQPARRPGGKAGESPDLHDD
jgi:hypothetical protein